MRYAIACIGDSVSPHFGRCKHFVLVDIEGNEVIKKENVDNHGHHIVSLPKFLRMKEVNYAVAGGMGPNAMEHLSNFGIKAIVGVKGKVDDVIVKIMDGSLQTSESSCDHVHNEDRRPDECGCRRGERRRQMCYDEDG